MSSGGTYPNHRPGPAADLPRPRVYRRGKGTVFPYRPSTAFTFHCFLLPFRCLTNAFPLSFFLPFRCRFPAFPLPYHCPLTAFPLPFHFPLSFPLLFRCFSTFHCPIAVLPLPYHRPSTVLSLPFHRPPAGGDDPRAPERTDQLHHTQPCGRVSRRRDCHLMAPPCTVSRCYNGINRGCHQHDSLGDG